jgi:Single-stranded DNA-binding protein
MNSLNSVLIEGVLTQDPESEVLASGSRVCTFTISTDRFNAYFYKNMKEIKKEAIYFNVEAWAKLGDSCVKNAKKDSHVSVVGRLAEKLIDFDGETISSVVIVAELIEFTKEQV